MKRILALASLLLLASLAFADSPHFISASAGLTTNDPDDLTVSFKESGLGNDVTVNYTVHVALATATYQCFNNGGKHPQAGNKETVSQSLTAHGTFSSGKNGSIIGSITVFEPSPGTFSCPNGQNLFLQSVSYSGITLTDDTFGQEFDFTNSPSMSFGIPGLPWPEPEQ